VLRERAEKTYLSFSQYVKANTIYSKTYELKKNFNNLTFAFMNGNQIELRSALVLFRIFNLTIE